MIDYVEHLHYIQTIESPSVNIHH
ncbi:MAG: hypothetical protein HW412_1971, partial [Bacteroidetes bacterium]|nr:hypothetical protein [Bacteroidota bacterium]